MRSHIPHLILGAILLAVMGVFAACDGGGGELTLEEFFQEVQELDDEFQASSDELGSEFETLTDESSVDDVVDVLRQQGDTIKEFVDGLADLDPPEEAAAIHEDAVSAGRDVIEEFETLLDDAEGVDSLDGLFALFDENDAFQDATTRFDQACVDAEQLAADNGITVELNCE